MLTLSQLQALKAAIFAETDSTVATARAQATRDDRILAAFYNGASTMVAWRVATTKADLFDALNIATFDNLGAGKRDAFRLLLDNAPVDFSRAPVRKGCADIFAVTAGYTDAQQAAQMLTVGTEFASRVEVLFGYTTPAAVAGVTAIKRNWIGPLSVDDTSAAMNLP